MSRLESPSPRAGVATTGTEIFSPRIGLSERPTAVPLPRPARSPQPNPDRRQQKPRARRRRERTIEIAAVEAAQRAERLERRFDSSAASEAPQPIAAPRGVVTSIGHAAVPLPKEGTPRPAICLSLVRGGGVLGRFGAGKAGDADLGADIAEAVTPASEQVDDGDDDEPADDRGRHHDYTRHCAEVFVHARIVGRRPFAVGNGVVTNWRRTDDRSGGRPTCGTPTACSPWTSSSLDRGTSSARASSRSSVAASNG